MEPIGTKTLFLFIICIVLVKSKALKSSSNLSAFRASVAGKDARKGIEKKKIDQQECQGKGSLVLYFYSPRHNLTKKETIKFPASSLVFFLYKSFAEVNLIILRSTENHRPQSKMLIFSPYAYTKT